MNEFESSGNALYDPEPWKCVAPIVQNWFSDHESFSDKTTVLEQYLDAYPRYIKSSNLNTITGLESLEYRDASLGVTQALDEFHWRCLKDNLRLRLFRGEYPYNKDVYPNWLFIDDADLQKGDAVIVSVPFSGNGSISNNFSQVLEQCERLDIPVFIDMAWFGTCKDIDINLEFECIKEVAFSLTKGLSCGQYRSGIRFSRHKHNFNTPYYSDRLTQQTQWNHSMHLNFAIGLELMQNFSADYIPNKYFKYHQAVCDDFGLTPSKCIHIATNNEPMDPPFNRDGAYNRINIRKQVKKFYRDRKI